MMNKSEFASACRKVLRANQKAQSLRSLLVEVGLTTLADRIEPIETDTRLAYNILIDLQVVND